MSRWTRYRDCHAVLHNWPAILAATLIVTACGDTATEPASPAVATIEVTTPTDSLSALGTIAQYSAVAKDAQGAVVPVATFTWSSTSPSVASVSGTGVATSVGNGTTKIRAQAGGRIGELPLRVAQTVSQVSLVLSKGTLTSIGDTTQGTAALKDATGHPVPGGTAGWQSSDTAIATVSPSGLVTAIADGTVSIIASSNGVADTAVAMIGQVASSIVISPQADTMTAIGDSIQLTVAVTDAMGHAVSGLTIGWMTLDTAVVRVTQGGTVIAKSNGQTTIVATTGSLADSVSIRVAQIVASIDLTPTADTLRAVGDTVRLAATARDSRGNHIPSTVFDWSSSDTSNAIVNASGLVTATSNGTATITVSVATVSATAAILVDIPTVIVFSTNRDGNWELYSILSDGSQLTRLTQTASPEQNPVISPDRLSVAYNGGAGIWVMDIDGSNQRQVVNGFIGAQDPTWAPDGLRLAFSGRQSGANYIPWQVIVSSGSTSPLPFGTIGQAQLTWSHSDSIIGAREQSNGVSVFGINHDSVRVLVNMVATAYPRFSPSGALIVFEGQEVDQGPHSLYTIHPDGTGLTQITTLSNYSGPTWSPDGSKLAYVQGGELWTMNLDGTNKRQLTNGMSPVLHPSWYN